MDNPPLPGRKKTHRVLATILLLVAGVFCLYSIHSLANGRSQTTQYDRDARNGSASELYVRLATLPQPIDTSSVTRTIHDFVRQDKLMVGATLIDADGELLAQLGSGNEDLSSHPDGTQSARIPIQSAGELFGHVVVAFQSSYNDDKQIIHYLALVTLSALSLTLLFGLLRYSSRRDQ